MNKIQREVIQEFLYYLGELQEDDEVDNLEIFLKSNFIISDLISHSKTFSLKTRFSRELLQACNKIIKKLNECK